MASNELRKVAFVGDYPPRRCGIATFTSDIRGAVADASDADCIVIPVDDIPEGYEYPPEVRFQIAEQDLESYRRAADFINFSDIDVVSLQHEFGIFGGVGGAHVLAMLRDLRVPVVTTLHTVLPEPDATVRRVAQQLFDASTRLVVMTERSRSILLDTYKVPVEKVDLIPHGIPDRPFADPNFFKDQFGVEGKLVGLTFGLLSPNKGIEVVLQALPEVIRQFPNFTYLVLGATHPNLVRHEGETYRRSLERMAQDLGVQKHVIFYNRFVELHELTDFIGAADMYITPYLNPAQAVSGTLSYSFGCGQAVISTPYWHAEELLADDRGVLVPFGDSQAMGEAIIAILQDDRRRHAMRKRAYLAGREMIWNKVAERYVESFTKARSGRTSAPRRAAARTLDQQPLALPRMSLDHLLRMTDGTGLMQHATFSVPNFKEGYCTDDNARALVLSVLLEDLGHDSREVHHIASRYAGFLNHAFDPETGRFRNFMGFDRRWLEETGSDDSLGRAVWALGACVARSKRRSLQAWAIQLLEKSLPAVMETHAPRTWAFALLGIHDYLQRLSGDRHVEQMRDALVDRLVAYYDQTASEDWPWFEDQATYVNAKLPHALIVGAKTSGNERALSIGLRSLRWLADVQTAPQGHFRPIGCHGFYPRGGAPAPFDQQPIEAHAMVSAAIEALDVDGDPFWWQQAHRAFDWFLGRNDIGRPVCNTGAGGCHDGIEETRLNENQGAESTLAYLLSLAEMKLLENTYGGLTTAAPSASTMIREPHHPTGAIHAR